MPTTNQLVRKGRHRKKKPTTTRALKGNPQLRAVVLRVFTMDPKKPNSANRKCVRVRLSNKMEVTAACPGHGLNLQEHSMCLIRGGRTPDCPGVKYKVVMGALDAGAVWPESDGNARNQGRSLYGVSKKGSKRSR